MTARRIALPLRRVVNLPQCPECGMSNVVRDTNSAEVVCMECGHVLSMGIADRGPEWRAFTAEQREIDRSIRLRKWQRRIRVSDAMERNLAFALTEITKIANSLDLPRSIIASILVGERRTQREIAEIAKVTEVTIRNRYKELVSNMTFSMEL